MPKLVLLALADMAGSSSDQAWPSIGYLVERTGMSRCSVMRAVQTLVNFKLVEVERRPNRTNIYRICKSHCETPVVSERDHGSLRERPPQSHSETRTYKEPRKNLPRTNKKPAPKFELPVALNTPEFKAAWEGFQEMRKAIKKPLTARAMSLVINKIELWGHDVAIEALDRSTTNNWQGVFDPRESRDQAKSKPAQAPAARSTWHIQQELTAVEELIKDVQKHRSEVAGGDYCWPAGTDHKAKWIELCARRKALRMEIAGLNPKPKPNTTQLDAVGALASAKRVNRPQAA